MHPHTSNATKMNITIIANGLFPEKPWVDTLLGHSDRVVCCDGAIEKYLSWHSRQTNLPTHPVDVVGDGDSLNPVLIAEAQRRGIDVHHYVVEEQEYNDLTKATRHAMEEVDRMGILNTEVCIEYIGATGLREDHTLGNISLLAYYMEQYPDITFHMVSDYGIFIPMHGRRRFHSHAGQQISIFSLSPDKPVTVNGLRWPIENRCLTSWWQGTLNEALGDTFTVQGGTIIVYLKR